MESIDANRFGNIILAAGVALYLIVFAARFAAVGVHAADQPLTLLIGLPLMLMVGAFLLTPLALYVGILAGVPSVSFSYGLAMLRRNWKAIVGGIFLVSALAAILAAAKA